MEKKKKIGIIVVAACFVVGLVLGISLGLANKKYRIAIYDLPKNVSEKLRGYVESSDKKFVVTVLDGGSGFSVAESKKYDAVFTWNGVLAENLAKAGVDIPAQAYSKMPQAVRRSCLVDGKSRMLPILYDHVPLYFCKDASTYNDFSGPETLVELEANMEADRENFSFPMLVAGSEDEDFYGFLSMAAESVLGADGYKALVKNLSEKKDFRAVLDDVVTNTPDGASLSLRSVLEKIFDWQSRGLLQRQWYMVGRTDLFNLMQYKSFYVSSMPLDYYRNLPRMVSYNYTAYRFPMENVDMDHGLVAHEIVMIPRSNKKALRNLEDYLVSLDIQEQLSNVTTFAPVHSQSGAYDSISDDARFYAASTKWGPLPQLDRAAFTSKDDAQKFAKDAREFFIVGE